MPSGKIETHFHLTPEAKALVRQQARRNGLSQSGFVETLIRRHEEDYRRIAHLVEPDLKQQLAADAKAQAMFAERNEYDR